MADEVLALLAPQPGETFVDATLGGGGHARLIADRLGRSGFLIGVDQDSDAIEVSAKTLDQIRKVGPRVATAHARFDKLTEVLTGNDASIIDGILFDLGVSSHQLDEPRRGFSFKDPSGPLDMRMDPASAGATAEDLLGTLSESELTRIFRDYADEKWAARIAQFIVRRRQDAPLVQAGDLIDTVKAAVPAAARAKDIHPATRVFQALRIAVNDEYAVLERGLVQAVAALRPGSGRIAVLSYHSGEDRIVKRVFGRLSGRCECPPQAPRCTCGAEVPALRLAMRKPLTPSAAEIGLNPRARSAKLRVALRS